MDADAMMGIPDAQLNAWALVIRGDLSDDESGAADGPDSRTPVGIVAAVAHNFSAVLREWLSAEDQSELAKRARDTGFDAPWCPSHDYCDANVAMARAFHGLGLLDPLGFVSDETRKHPSATGNETNAWLEYAGQAERLWDLAWRHAKANGFWIDDTAIDATLAGVA